MKKAISLFTLLVCMLSIAVAQDGTKPKAKARPNKEVQTEKAQKAEKAKKEEKVIRKEDPKNEANFIETPANGPKDSKKEAAVPAKNEDTPGIRNKDERKAKEAKQVKEVKKEAQK